jgi:hypothetical protein
MDTAHQSIKHATVIWLASRLRSLWRKLLHIGFLLSAWASLEVVIHGTKQVQVYLSPLYHLQNFDDSSHMLTQRLLNNSSLSQWLYSHCFVAAPAAIMVSLYIELSSQ